MPPEFDIQVQLVRIIQVYLAETCSKVMLGKCLSSTLLFQMVRIKDMLYCHFFEALVQNMPLGTFKQTRIET